MQIYVVQNCGGVYYGDKSTSFIRCYLDLFYESDFIQINDLYVM
jgi:hypothetical protein